MVGNGAGRPEDLDGTEAMSKVMAARSAKYYWKEEIRRLQAMITKQSIFLFALLQIPCLDFLWKEGNDHDKGRQQKYTAFYTVLVIHSPQCAAQHLVGTH